jgi:serine O-acetyltransferase
MTTRADYTRLGRTLERDRVAAAGKLLLDVVLRRSAGPEAETIATAAAWLAPQIEAARAGGRELPAGDALTAALIRQLPDLAQQLDADVSAAYERDPAARSESEVRLAYPGVEATAVYRIAHFLDGAGALVVPRILADWARERTGAELHPSARIGESFFLDHATGTIVGETARVGSRVTLYEGVILGTKQFELDATGLPVKGSQRHPTLEDDVTVFAHSMVLGGDTRVGEGSIIGTSVILTHSVPARSFVRHAASAPRISPLAS